jgi:hypothetical protein
MGTMNGNPYYSGPTRHTRCLGDRFIDPVIPGEPASLEELPFLVAKAIKEGLIQMPDKEEPPVEAQPKREFRVAEWQKVTCIKCQQPFVRMHPKHSQCNGCRTERPCSMCGKLFKPRERWLKRCSEACVKKSYVRPVKLRPVCTCTVCGCQFEGRMSGVGWAKTCNSDCAKKARDNYHAERRALRVAAKDAKQ